MVGSDLGAAADTSDIVYIKTASSSKNADGWETTLFHVDGSGKDETVTTKNADANKFFYTFTINDDDVYELTKIGANDAEYSLDKKGDDYYTANSKAMAYDDETGFVLDAFLDGLKNSALTLKSSDYHFTADDVALGDNVIIIDHRTADERNVDGYKTEITNASALAKAIAKNGWVVTANVFFDDEKVVLIAVTDMFVK